MIKYGEPSATELKFVQFHAELERKSQWVDFYLTFDLAEGQSFPDDLSDPGALVISTYDGRVIEYVVQDGGCDTEYQFTEEEKAQIAHFVQQQLTDSNH